VRTFILRSALLAGCTAAVVMVPATAAFAHAETEVGPYTVAIGFGAEPAYVGSPNSVELIVHQTSSGKGVTTAANTLKTTIAFGSAQPMSVSLEPNFDTDSGGYPGDYRGAFVPTQPGSYTIHVQGKIGSTSFDKTFTSSPTTFDTVTDPATIEYPTKNPTVTELSAKLDREIARVQADATAQVTSARDSASSAKTIAIVAIIVGIVGLGVGAFGMVRKRG
jgi:hypothetical protein